MPAKRFLTLLLFLVVLFSSIVVAQQSDRWPYTSQFIDVNVEVGSGINVIKTRPDAILDLAMANVSFIPQENERQKIMFFESEPEPTKHTDDTIEYVWHHPLEDDLSFSFNAQMRGYNTYTKIPAKVGYPIVTLPFEIIKYTKPSPNIDSLDEDIHEIASSLAEGEDDMYVVVYKMAQWTKQNVAYNLSTLTVDVSQPASWVLEHRTGVCDELTSLFIAMLRSIGIPARFVSGVAYTDLPEFSENWGGHGWAEVYFPGHGWSDWDVTYGEYGFVDPTHLKLKDGVDSDESATIYVWQGRGVEATAKEMSLSGKLERHFGKIDPRIKINASTMYKSVGIGSYNIVQADVTNLEDSYISTVLYLAPTQNVEMITDLTQIIYLAPGQTRKILWIVKVEDGMDTGYIYTFPMTVVSLRNISSKTSFVAMEGESMFTLTQMQQVVDAYKSESQSRPEAQLTITCLADKQYYYGYDKPKISCALKNTGNLKLTNVEVCLETECDMMSLRLNQEKMMEYSVETLNYGKNQLILSARNLQVSKSFIFDIFVMDDPRIEVDSVVVPINVTYKENFTIDFTLERKSTSRPVNVTVSFTNGGIEEEWFISEMENNQRYVIDLFGSSLHAGNNTFNVNMTYYDYNGLEYSAGESFVIELVDVTYGQRFMIFMRDLEYKLRQSLKMR